MSGGWKKGLLEGLESPQVKEPVVIDLNNHNIFYESIHKQEAEMTIPQKINTWFAQKELQNQIIRDQDENHMKLEFEPSKQFDVIVHTKPAQDLKYVEFNINQVDFDNFHQSDITRYMPAFKEKYLRGTVQKQRRPAPWDIKMVRNTNQLNAMSMLRKRNAYEELTEQRDSFEKFQDQKRLSLKGEDFFLLEYIEESPLIMTTFGMASKLVKHIYPNRVKKLLKKMTEQSENLEETKSFLGSQTRLDSVLRQKSYIDTSIRSRSRIDESENRSQTASFTTKMQKEDNVNEMNQIKEKIAQMFGAHGSIRFLKKKDEIPLLGQLTNVDYCGVFVMRNNLYVVPLFKQEADPRDFVLVTRFERNKLTQKLEQKQYLRKVKHIYTAGQIEPLMEVFSPSSRKLQKLITKILKFYIRHEFRAGREINVPKLSRMFETLNETIIRKNIRILCGQSKQSDSKTFYYCQYKMQRMDEERQKELDQGLFITPEEISLYESMRASLNRLKNFGVLEQRSIDKLMTAQKKYRQMQSTKQKNKIEISKLITEELKLTSWNLSQSFIRAKQQDGRLYLTGLGDPTNGRGGLSFVKKPLKTSRYDKDTKDSDDLDESMSTQMQLSGSDADLRRLPLEKVHALLRKYGFKVENYMKRWEKIHKLREIANRETTKNPDSELATYARTDRVTSKMQREIYQKRTNKMLTQVIDLLGKQNSDGVESDTSQGSLVDRIKGPTPKPKKVSRQSERKKVVVKPKKEDFSFKITLNKGSFSML